jgi:hypothetical protein
MTRKLALVIGTSEYQDPALARLKAPDADVQELSDLLRHPAIGQFDEVQPLVNASEAATRRAIASFFARARPDDMLLLYFSGHGVLDDKGRLYLAAQDTQRDLPHATAISAAFVTDAMDSSRSRRQVLILDCCHSGAFARGARSPGGAKAVTEATFEGLGYGRAVLTATDATQYAWEGEAIMGEADNSVFTHFMIEGLKSGAADTDNDGDVTLEELYNYLYGEVVRITPKQTPRKWSYNQQGEFVIARNPHPRAPQPTPLPEDLQHSVEDLRPWVREGAVRELERLLLSGGPGLAAAALAALQRLKDDDSRRVSLAAGEVLARLAAQEAAGPIEVFEPPASGEAGRPPTGDLQPQAGEGARQTQDPGDEGLAPAQGPETDPHARAGAPSDDLTMKPEPAAQSTAPASLRVESIPEAVAPRVEPAPELPPREQAASAVDDAFTASAPDEASTAAAAAAAQAPPLAEAAEELAPGPAWREAAPGVAGAVEPARPAPQPESAAILGAAALQSLMGTAAASAVADRAPAATPPAALGQGATVWLAGAARNPLVAAVLIGLGWMLARWLAQLVFENLKASSTLSWLLNWTAGGALGGALMGLVLSQLERTWDPKQAARLLAGLGAGAWALSCLIGLAIWRFSYDLNLSLPDWLPTHLALPVGMGLGGYALGALWRQARPGVSSGQVRALAAGWAAAWLIGDVVVFWVYQTSGWVRSWQYGGLAGGLAMGLVTACFAGQASAGKAAAQPAGGPQPEGSRLPVPAAALTSAVVQAALGWGLARLAGHSLYVVLTTTILTNDKLFNLVDLASWIVGGALGGWLVARALGVVGLRSGHRWGRMGAWLWAGAWAVSFLVTVAMWDAAGELGLHAPSLPSAIGLMAGGAIGGLGLAALWNEKIGGVSARQAAIIAGGWAAGWLLADVIRWAVINAFSWSNAGWIGGWTLGGVVAGLAGMGVMLGQVTRRHA